MNAKERQAKLLHMLRSAKSPLSGSFLSKELGVSRQIIVQDIAALRADQHDIYSGNRGYLLQSERGALRVFKVLHTEEETEKELNLIIDSGGWVKDVFVYHKTYGVIRADLNIQSRMEIEQFLDEIRSGKSSMLLNVTSGYHYHTVLAKDEPTLDRIQQKLSEEHFLAKLQDYEPVNFWEKDSEETR